MADLFSKKKRSEIMSRIRGKNTKPESTLWKLVRHVVGQQCRLLRNHRSLPGTPDIVIPKLQIAMFVEGCFFHACPRHGHLPKSNRIYWRKKLDTNMHRDAVTRRELRAMGFSVWRFWEHDLKRRALERTTARLRRRLDRHIQNNPVDI